MTLTVGPTVEELIGDDLVSTLGGINGIGWNTTVADVRDSEEDVIGQLIMPSLNILHGSVQVIYQPGWVHKHAMYFIVLGLDARTSTPRADMNRYIADVETALVQTHTRGGNAVETRIENSEITARTLEDPVIIGMVTVVVIFRHQFAEPTTPK